MSDSQEYPLVSAIMLAGRMPTAAIKAAIACFRAQTYPYKELIVVNNARTQFEASALNLRAERDVMVVDTATPYSAGMARNYGISTANGRILAQFDANYWHAPDRLEAQVATMAQNGASVVVLTQTLRYSFISGRASLQSNDRNAILGTMLFVRPQGLDYPNADKQEEWGLLDKFQQAQAKVISMPTPGLMCKLCGVPGKMKPTNSGLSTEEFATIRKFLRNYRASRSVPVPGPAARKS